MNYFLVTYLLLFTPWRTITIEPKMGVVQIDTIVIRKDSIWSICILFEIIPKRKFIACFARVRHNNRLFEYPKNSILVNSRYRKKNCYYSIGIYLDSIYFCMRSFQVHNYIQRREWDLVIGRHKADNSKRSFIL